MKLPPLVCLAVLATPVACRAQAPASVCVDVSLVNVGFSVRHLKGNLVTSLTQRSSFELAYHTSHPPGDRTFHKMVIQPKQPGLSVRAKTGCYAR